MRVAAGSCSHMELGSFAVSRASAATLSSVAPAHKRITHARSTPAATRRRTDPPARREPGDADAQRRLDALMDRYDRAIASVAREALTKLKARWPDAVRMAYDNYNTLAIGFGPTDRASDAIRSIALYPRWVNLFFLHGANAGRLIIKSISAKQRPRRATSKAKSKSKA
jgi:hypothetical protein